MLTVNSNPATTSHFEREYITFLLLLFYLWLVKYHWWSRLIAPSYQTFSDRITSFSIDFPHPMLLMLFKEKNPSCYPEKGQVNSGLMLYIKKTTSMPNLLPVGEWIDYIVPRN
jgi:hypothetical protein